ncbi:MULTISPECIES: phosphopantetheine-binding protein [Helicobacter]|uniref:phosphopantetheine-binding protein n=1 Tax=Helicobacter TaxID=209 RepID=UPI00235669B5|nr:MULTISPECIES: phosphopantetheine-binding protein [Helicobacter]
MIQQMLLEFFGEKGIAFEGEIQSANTFEVIDSMGFLELLNFLEQRTGTELDLSALDLEDFATLGGLVKSIEKILKA